MATNTTATTQTHNGDGSTATFAISFSFLENTEVDVTVGGVLKTLGTHYNISGSSVTFTSGNIPPSGTANIKFTRDTNISTKKVDFADGSVLTETDLDNNSNQILFAQQEITDKVNGIEEGATADQTAAEIRTLVESASDSNVFTDADHSKLNAIEAGATGDQTASEIRTLVENASDSNVFTDADHTKLNNIEANATADQTAAEIRTLVESASDSNVFTDADHTKLNAIEAGATADQTAAEIKSLIASSPLDASHLAANSVGTSEIADAELTTLAGMQSGTASKLADSTALTADLADLNQLDGMAKQTTITDDDTKFPTSGAVVDYVSSQLDDIGGFESIANELSFPNTQAPNGVSISIADAAGLVVNGSGVSTTGRTLNGTTVTINNIPSNFHSSTVASGVRFIVTSTGSNQIYNYHKATLAESDLVGLSGQINDFSERYRVGSTNPTSNNDAGDLFFNTSTNKLLVYNGTSGAFEEAQSIGNFFISTLSPAFDGTTTDFTITNAPTNAQQILLSIEGVIQKPNSGTSTPSEGFALSGSTVKLAVAPATGASYHAVVMGSTVNIGVPSNNTVTSAILQNGSVIAAKIGTDAVTSDKIQDDAVTNAKIADDAIDSPQIADGAVDTVHIADLNVDTSKINNNAVTTAKIADDAVTAAKLADSSVQNATIATGAVTTAKINDGAVTTAKIANDAVTGVKIAAEIDNSHITSSANIAGSKLADDSISLAKLEHGTSSNDGKFLRANNGADPSFESLPASGKATNLVINGDMKVAQRATSTTASGYKSIDRWQHEYAGTDESPTFARSDVVSSDSGDNPFYKGITRCVKITNGNQTSGLQNNSILNFNQNFEAQDIRNSGWNYNSSSSYMTLSFYVKASVSQNYHGFVKTQDGTNYLYQYETGTLTANTWTRITKTFSGHSNLQINNDATGGFQVFPIFFGGSNYTDNSINHTDWQVWNSGQRSKDQASNWWTTNDATLEITGVQLEIGNSVSDFATESYAETLRKCQRYYWKINQGTYRRINGYKRGDSNCHFELHCPVPMRAAPSPTLLVSGTFTNFQSNFNTTQSSPTVNEWNLDTGQGLLVVSSDWSSTHVAIPSWEGYSIEFNAEL